MKHTKSIILFLTTIFFNCSLMSMEQISNDVATHIITLCTTQSRNDLHCVSHNFHRLCSYNNLSAILDHKHDALSKKEKEYALLWATQRSNYGTVKRLLECGADPNINHLIHLSPLTIARKKNDFPIIKLLKQHGCLTTLTHNAPPAFIIAMYTKDINTLQQCINHDEYDPLYTFNTSRSNGILDIAAHIGDANILTILLAQPALCAQINNTIYQSLTPCNIAAVLGHTAFIETLIAHPDTNINKTDRGGFSPAYRAAIHGHWDVVKLLTSHKNYNINEQNINGATQLYTAAENNHIEAAKVFLADQNIDVNCLYREKYTPLHIAAHNGHTRMVKLLLTHPSTKEDFTGEATSLYVAAQNGHLNCVKILCLANPSMINTPFDTSWTTPIWIAVIRGHLEIVKHLLSYEITDTNVTDGIGATLLHAACDYNHPEIVTSLLEHSPHLINICNNNGDSPLHVAASRSFDKIVEILVKAKNVNVNIINTQGHTPLDNTLRGNATIANLLIAHGGKEIEDIKK